MTKPLTLVFLPLLGVAAAVAAIWAAPLLEAASARPTPAEEADRQFLAALEQEDRVVRPQAPVVEARPAPIVTRRAEPTPAPPPAKAVPARRAASAESIRPKNAPPSIPRAIPVTRRTIAAAPNARKVRPQPKPAELQTFRVLKTTTTRVTTRNNRDEDEDD